MFLALILDAYWRRVLGWELNRMLENDRTIAVLRMVLARRSMAPG